MNESSPLHSVTEPDDFTRRLERRVARLEKHLGLEDLPEAIPTPGRADVAAITPAAGGMSESAPGATQDEDALEYEVGQKWFAKIGIVALATGVAFLISQPFAGLPSAAPSLMGYGLVVVLFALAHLGRNSFDLVSRYFRGAAMVLLFIATLRLFFLGAVPAMSIESMAGRALLLVVVALNLALALHRRSPWLAGIGIVMSCAAALAGGAPWFVLGVLTILAGVVGRVRVRYAWPAIGLVATVLMLASYVVWAIGNPLLGHDVKVVTAPVAAPFFVLLWIVISAIANDQRRDRAVEDDATQVGALLHCGVGYLVFLAHLLLGYESVFIVGNLTAFVVFLALAVLFWLRERSRIATFLYAMTGYMALSMAIIKAAGMPEVFVWLSLQSLVVVTTAIWFRSRFIVVANFLIVVVIMIAYVAMAKVETGISLGFGVVALVSARILNWQKERLDLRTEAMRNAYLVCAFLVFPYALYHLVPEVYLVPAWVGMALLYYSMNLVIRNRKYRWMGHGTLLLSAAYIVIIGIGRLEGTQRIVSFLMLGGILLLVSLIFTRVRARRHTGDSALSDVARIDPDMNRQDK